MQSLQPWQSWPLSAGRVLASLGRANKNLSVREAPSCHSWGATAASSHSERGTWKVMSQRTEWKAARHLQWDFCCSHTVFIVIVWQWAFWLKVASNEPQHLLFKRLTMATEDCMTRAKRRVSSNQQTFRKLFILCCWVSEWSFTNLYGAMVTCWICWWSDLLQVRYVTYIHPSYLPKHQIICFDLIMHIREREKKKKWTCKAD